MRKGRRGRERERENEREMGEKEGGEKYMK